MTRTVADIKSDITEHEKELARLRCELREATISEQMQNASSERMRKVKARVIARLESGYRVIGFNGRFWWGSEQDPVKERATGDEMQALDELAEAGIVERGQT